MRLALLAAAAAVLLVVVFLGLWSAAWPGAAQHGASAGLGVMAEEVVGGAAEELEEAEGPGVVVEKVYVVGVEGVAHRPVRVEGWEVVVSDVAVVDEVALGDVCYGAGEGGRLVVVRVEVRNLGNGSARFPLVSPFYLLTDRDLEDLWWTEERPRPYPIYREGRLYIPGARTVECGGGALRVDMAWMYAEVPPNASVGGYAVFAVPAGEEPKELRFRVLAKQVHVPGYYMTAYGVVVRLSASGPVGRPGLLYEVRVLRAVNVSAAVAGDVVVVVAEGSVAVGLSGWVEEDGGRAVRGLPLSMAGPGAAVLRLSEAFRRPGVYRVVVVGDRVRAVAGPVDGPGAVCGGGMYRGEAGGEGERGPRYVPEHLLVLEVSARVDVGSLGRLPAVFWRPDFVEVEVRGAGSSTRVELWLVGPLSLADRGTSAAYVRDLEGRAVGVCAMHVDRAPGAVGPVKRVVGPGEREPLAAVELWWSGGWLGVGPCRLAAGPGTYWVDLVYDTDPPVAVSLVLRLGAAGEEGGGRLASSSSPTDASDMFMFRFFLK